MIRRIDNDDFFGGRPIQRGPYGNSTGDRPISSLPPRAVLSPQTSLSDWFQEKTGHNSTSTLSSIATVLPSVPPRAKIRGLYTHFDTSDIELSHKQNLSGSTTVGGEQGNYTMRNSRTRGSFQSSGSGLSSGWVSPLEDDFMRASTGTSVSTSRPESYLPRLYFAEEIANRSTGTLVPTPHNSVAGARSVVPSILNSDAVSSHPSRRDHSRHKSPPTSTYKVFPPPRDLSRGRDVSRGRQGSRTIFPRTEEFERPSSSHGNHKAWRKTSVEMTKDIQEEAPRLPLEPRESLDDVHETLGTLPRDSMVSSQTLAFYHPRDSHTYVYNDTQQLDEIPSRPDSASSEYSTASSMYIDVGERLSRLQARSVGTTPVPDILIDPPTNKSISLTDDPGQINNMAQPEHLSRESSQERQRRGRVMDVHYDADGHQLERSCSRNGLRFEFENLDSGLPSTKSQSRNDSPASVIHEPIPKPVLELDFVPAASEKSDANVRESMAESELYDAYFRQSMLLKAAEKLLGAETKKTPTTPARSSSAKRPPPITNPGGTFLTNAIEESPVSSPKFVWDQSL